MNGAPMQVLVCVCVCVWCMRYRCEFVHLDHCDGVILCVESLP